jgi:CRISPR/Cas system-associated endonuclease Cas1
MLNVDRVILMGRGVSITTPALHALTRRNIEVLFFNRRGGFISRLVGREHRHSRLRQVQALVSADLTRHRRWKSS